VHAPTAAGREAADKAGRSALTFHAMTADGSQRFHDAISAAKASSRFGASVHVYAPNEYRGTRMFLTPDGKAGFTLKPDGDIVSAFKNSDATDIKKGAAAVLALATQKGGRKLDAFDTVLPRTYSESGFRAVARLAWNDEHKPDDWNYDTFKKFNGGRPDVVFMVHDPANAKLYAPGDGKRVSSYDEGVAEQAKALAEIDAAKAKRQARWQVVKAQALALLQRFDPDEPRDESGKWTEGGGDGGGAAEAAPAAAEAGKKPVEISDFAKDDIALDPTTRSNPDTQKKFVDTWNSKIAEAPAEFKEKFLGGLDGTMRLEFNDYNDKMTVTGALKGEAGQRIGEYTRTIDFKNNKASSDYFKLYSGHTGGNTGKVLLAANVDMYKKLGLDAVEVHANIDVGGYAWAKYGYVPTPRSWRQLSDEIDSKLSRGSGGGGGYAGSWDEIGSGRQSDIESAFMRSTAEEFYDSEVNNWRENGSALEEAKVNLANDFGPGADWAEHAIAGYGGKREDQGKSEIPFTDEQILNAISISYESRYGDGRGDPDVTFDDDKLTEPQGFDPAQQTLPGIPPIAPHEHLTEEMRDGLTKAIENAFNDEADSNAADIEPPDYLRESVEQYQGEYWDSMSDEDKYAWAKRNEPDLVEGDADEEPPSDIESDDVDRLRELAQSGDPKALWLIADSKYGKDLLLGSDWQGVINLHDKQTMDRFNAYVGKAKA
jgi:hypothetical protein